MRSKSPKDKFINRHMLNQYDSIKKTYALSDAMAYSDGAVQKSAMENIQFDVA